MKTTIEISDALLIRAKKRSAEIRRPLRYLIEEGLKAELAAPSTPAKERRVRWVTTKGGLPAGCDVSRRDLMCDWIRSAR